MKIFLMMPAVGKPTMVRGDKWKERPCVLAYRAFCDALRYKAFGKNTKQKLASPAALSVTCYFRAKEIIWDNRPHAVKPDADNILKAVSDALFSNDHMIYRTHCEKYWSMSKDMVIVEMVESTS